MRDPFTLSLVKQSSTNCMSCSLSMSSKDEDWFKECHRCRMIFHKLYFPDDFDPWLICDVCKDHIALHNTNMTIMCTFLASFILFVCVLFSRFTFPDAAFSFFMGICLIKIVNINYKIECLNSNRSMLVSRFTLLVALAMFQCL